MGPICGNAVCCSTSKIGFLMQFNMYIYQYLELNWWYAWESISSKNKHDINFQNPIMQFIIIIRCIHNKNSLFCLGKLVRYTQNIYLCKTLDTPRSLDLMAGALMFILTIDFFELVWFRRCHVFLITAVCMCIQHTHTHTHLSCTISCLCLIIGTQK